MKKNIHIILTIILTPVIYSLILKYGFTFTYCSELSGYNYDDLKIIGRLFKLVLRFLGICSGGILVFYLLNKYIPQFKNKYLQTAFIISVYTFLLYPGLRAAIQNKNDAKYISSLCTKTSGDPMRVKSENVNYQEYQYLQGELVLLPDIPSRSDSIQIQYYHDGFLPDFSLFMIFRVPLDEPIKTDERNWFEKSRNTTHKWIEFHDDES